MSIFPRHVTPGSTVFIHVRLPRPEGTLVQASRIQLTVRPPSGDASILADETIAVLAAPEAAQVSDVPFHVLASSMSAQDARRLEKLNESTQGVHHYHSYPVGADAELGRYEVDLRSQIAGSWHRSGTADSDHFFVEDIEVLPDGGGVTNLGPLGVRVELLSGAMAEVEHRLLAGGETIRPANNSGCTIVSWAGGRALRVIAPREELVVCQSTEFAVIDGGDSRSVALTDDGRSLILGKTEYAVWRAAVLPATVRQLALRASTSTAVIESVVASGLLAQWSSPSR